MVSSQDPPTPAPDLLPELRQQLGSSDPVERMRAARFFCDVEDPAAIPQLLTLLADPCLLVRVSAAYALGRNSRADIVPILIKTFQQEWNGYVRKGLVWALGNSQDPRALPVLAAAVQDDIAAVRLWAASAIGQLGAKVKTPTLLHEPIQILLRGCQTDPVAAVRSNCAWALGQLHPLLRDPQLGEWRQQVLEVLVQMQERDPDLSVQEDARQAWQKLQS
ncbi:MAG: HEAT repeat domain-containing protein [Thermostichales cyanobacterium BF4_bins_65]